MKGLEHYNFTYKDGRPLEDFDLKFVVFNSHDFTDELGHKLTNYVDFQEIVRAEGVEWMKELL